MDKEDNLKYPDWNRMAGIDPAGQKMTNPDPLDELFDQYLIILKESTVNISVLRDIIDSMEYDLNLTNSKKRM